MVTVKDFLSKYQQEDVSLKVRITVFDVAEGTWYGEAEDEFFNKELVIKNWGEYYLTDFCFCYDEDLDVYELAISTNPHKPIC